MVASILKQAAEILRKRKNSRRWQKMILCLAIVAAAGTIMILMTTGQALTKKGKVLDCKLEVHEHTDECYDGEGELICGYADFVIHEHNDDCYDTDGNLVCALPEIELHEHDASCYEEQRVLICKEGKNAGAGTEVNAEEEKRQDTSAGETPSHSGDGNSGSGDSNSNSGDGDGNNSGGGEVLDCGKEEHTHGDGCYETKSCDKEEHSHDNGCYDENGELNCGKDEHSHDDGCEGEVLACDKEEHTHSGECYSTESISEGGMEATAAENEAEAAAESDGAESEPAEADHNDTNIEESNTEETAETEENSGTEETAETEENSGTEETAGTEENAGVEETAGTEETADTEAAENKEEAAAGHIHTEECYGEETELVLVCEELGQGLHTHVKELVEDGGCYDSSAFDEETGDFIEGSRPVCGLLQLEEHVHTEDCFTNDPDYIFTKACEGEGFIVTAEYTGKADIPEEAELRAELVAADSEHYAQREAEYKETLEDEHASMRALMKIGFYVDDEEIEPKDDVTITVQFLDEDGLAEGRPITVVHFAEEGAEVLDGGKAENQSITFKTESFCEFGIGFAAENNDTIYVSQKYVYKDDTLKITFHVDGSVSPKNKGEKLPEYATDIVSEEILPVIIVERPAEDTNVSETDTEKAETTDEAFSKNDTETPDTEGDKKSEEVTDSEENGEEVADSEEKEETVEETEESAKANSKEEVSEDENGSKVETQSEEPAETDSEEEVSEEENDSGAESEADSEEVNKTENDGENQAADVGRTSASTSKDAKLEFRVELLEEDSKMYEAVKNYVDESDENVTGRILQALTYSMTYDGIELNLSECKVTAEIIPGETLLQEVQKLAGEDGESEVAYSFTALGVTEEIKNDIRVKELKSAELDEILNGAVPEEEPVGDTIEGELESSTAEYNMPERYDSAPKSRLGFISALTLSLDTDMLEDDTSEDDETEDITPEEDVVKPENKSGFTMFLELHDDTMAVVDRSASNPIFKVQYYAYVQKLATENLGGAEAIKIIDTVKAGQDGILGGAELPSNSKTPKTRNLFVKKAANTPATAAWPAYDPVYYAKDSAEALTKIYTSDLYEYSKVSGDLKYINKFAKDGMNYELCEVWVLKEGKDPDSTKKADWNVYSGADIDKLVFRNNSEQVAGEVTIQVTKDTVIRLVGKSNTEVNKNYPARFFDYDFTDGITNRYLQGINNPSNYKKNTSGAVKTPRYGFGNNSSGATGLKDDKLNGYNINIARSPADSIIKKCSFGIVNSSLSSSGLPVIRANAPDLFNPQAKNVKGKTEITGRSLNFNRDGDTYTLTSVGGSGNFAKNLEQFQKRPEKAYGTKDQIWTNQFWPMDNAFTFGDTANGHDPKFGTQKQHDDLGGLAVSDDGKEHNSFFGMTFDVEFELTEDYTGPLNYYFFGDDDMWVFLEDPNGNTQLICDIGGVHQAAGEYVDLWNYIQKPDDTDPKLVDPDATDENRVNPKYKLKFFYTERGASGSTCWMQFTLPSVNAVPVKDYTGNVKNTLTLNKTVEGTVTDELFDFTITFYKKGVSNVGTDNYPYEIKNEKGTLVKTGDIRSGGTFKLGHNQSIEVFNLPEGTTYTITETADGFEGELGDGSTGKIEKDKTIEGKIDYKVDDKLDYINKAIPYELPETGGPGPIPYTIAGVLVALFGAGFMYRKKSGKEGAGIS